MAVDARLPHMRELDALRGLACLLVYLLHSQLISFRGRLEFGGVQGSLMGAFVHAGHSGVSLFFVLSGFLVGRPFLVEAAGGPRVVRRHYFLRRALRVLPMYALVVLVGAAFYAARFTDLLRAVPWLLFLQPFGLTTPFPVFSAVWWSLSTEAHFYLLLPLLPWLLRERWRAVVASCLYGAGLAAFAIGVFTPRLGLGVWAVSHSLLGRAPLLVLGMTAAWLHGWYGEAIRSRWAATGRIGRLAADVLLVGVFALLAVLLRWVAGIGYFIGETPPWFGWHLAEGLLWTSVLLWLLLGPGHLRVVLVSRPLVALGVISYSVYLLHLPLLWATVSLFGLRGDAPPGWRLDTIVALATGTTVCLALSTCTYRLIERPAMRWIGRRLRTPPAPVASDGCQGASPRPLPGPAAPVPRAPR